VYSIQGQPNLFAFYNPCWYTERLS